MTKLNAKGSLRLATSTLSPVKDWAPPPMPPSLPKVLKGQFDQVCRNLYAEGLWHDDRLPLVVSYLSSAYVVDRLTATINLEGVVVGGKVNPAATSLSAAVATLAKAGAVLGLTVVRSSPIVAEQPPATGTTKGSKWAAAAGAE